MFCEACSKVRAEAAAEAAKAERARISGITALADKHGMTDLGRQLIEGGRSLDEARAAVLEKIGAKVEPVGEKATMPVAIWPWDSPVPVWRSPAGTDRTSAYHWLAIVDFRKSSSTVCGPPWLSATGIWIEKSGFTP